MKWVSCQKMPANLGVAGVGGRGSAMGPLFAAVPGDEQPEGQWARSVLWRYLPAGVENPHLCERGSVCKIIKLGSPTDHGNVSWSGEIH